MKTTLPVLLLCSAALLPASAQLAPTDPTAATLPVSAAAALAAISPTPDGYSVTEIGPNHRRWSRMTALPDGFGDLVFTTNSYIELQDSLYFVRQGPTGPEWAESKAEIEAFPGGAIARQGPVQMIFPNDLSAEPIDAQTAAGRFRSTLACLSYADYGLQTNLIIAELQPCQGEIIAPNQVLYPKALSDNVNGSVRYTYRKSGWEQDILIDDPGSLPTPESMGLDSGSPNLVLQVTTEFLEAPLPQTSQRTLTTDGLTVEDTEVDWGALRLGQGQAFFFGQAGSGTPVATSKRWQVTPDHRKFLVEEVPFSQLLRQILSRSGGASLDNPGRKFRTLASLDRLPRLKPAKPNTKLMELAAVRPPERGLLIDYVTVTSSATNYTFQSDSTYYISGTISLAGTTVCEGGTVIKFTNFPTAKISMSGPLQCNVAQYRPVVMTSRNDNTAGETITGSTGNPTNYNGATYLQDSANQNNAYRNLRLLYAGTGLSAASFSNAVWHCQFVKCGTAINSTSNAPVVLRNVLIAECTNAVVTTGVLRAEHLTADRCTTLLSGAGSSGYVTNSLITAVNTLGNVSLYNSSQFTSGAGVYQTVGASSYYLADGSTNRNAGLTNINPTLAHDLTLRTTYPPIVWSNVVVSTATTLWPQAQRDTDLPDLGFHADPLDHCVNGVVVTNCTLLLTNGVALGTYGATGIRLYGQLVSRGLANNLNQIVRYNTVQEQSTTNWAYSSTGNGVSTAGNSPLLQSAFTAWSVLASYNGYHAYCGTLNTPSWLAHSQFRGGTFYASGGNIYCTNCLWERVSMSLYSISSGFGLYNNLFRGGTLSYGLYVTNPPVFAKDNLFDGTSITANYYNGYTFSSSYNGYVTNCNRLPGSSGQDRILTNRPVYQTSYLGSYYYPTNDGMLSTLIDAGSRWATNATLYHFTTTTNQVKEGATKVDIGFHFVAIDLTTGQPYDADGDGVPDYLEDTNGNGVYGAGDLSDWRTYNSPNGLTGSSGLKVFTPLK